MITRTRWFTGRACIGIVQVVQDHELDEYKATGRANFKYYIGTGRGYNEQYDAEHIADWGTPFDQAAGDVMFGVAAGT